MRLSPHYRYSTETVLGIIANWQTHRDDQQKLEFDFGSRRRATHTPERTQPAM
jgi:hypothetical protein